MLVLAAAEGASLDAGSVGLALARMWSAPGERVLFVDADVTGARLSQRLGDVRGADYSPARRGLPSLMMVREALTLRLLADHCYSLESSAGSLWALFGPAHPAGGEHAARWLAARSDELAAVDAERSVVVSSSLTAGAPVLAPLLRDGVLVTVAPVHSVEAAKELWQQCRDLKLSGPRCRCRVLIVEGHTPLSDEEIELEAGMNVAGRLPVIDDERILRPQGGRRERAHSRSFAQIASRLLRYSRLVAAQSRPTARTDPQTMEFLLAPGLADAPAEPPLSEPAVEAGHRATWSV